MDERLRALNRFGLGARVGEAPGLPTARRWLLDQLDGADAALAERPPGMDVPGEEEGAAAVAALLEALRSRDREEVRTARRAAQEVARREVEAALELRIRTERPFVERLVAFWSNHLCVSMAGKPFLAPLAGLYERQAIRPHVLGRFEEMVLASARHPAMLVYLDNVRSVGPGSPAAAFVGRRSDREPGLNENYARELLELHTLGVDGGYGQEDVEELARLLTGWTVAGLGGPGDLAARAEARRGAGARRRPGGVGRRRPGGPGARRGRGSGRRSGPAPERGFAFQPLLHDPGEKRILGTVYGEGREEGERAIRDLCRHPATARFVAGKLVRHFVADEPPARAVDAVATTFRETGGDLRAVAVRLVALEEAWDPSLRKFRTPQDWLVAVLRAVHARELPDPAPGILRQLRHTPWAPPAPAGYGDAARDWADPDSLMNRAELARSVADRLAGAEVDPRRLLEVVEVQPGDPLPALLSDSGIDPAERLALALGGPAFQWR
jgi:uncharacterized protein (DUF1800 family)